MQLNPSKCKELQSCFTRSPPTHSPVELDGLAFDSVNSAKVLGVTIRDDFKWKDHIFNVTSKAAKRLYLLSQLKRAGICASDLVLFYCSTIRSVLEYACQDGWYFTPVFRTIYPRSWNVFRSAPCALSFLMQATTARSKRQASPLFMTGERLYRLIRSAPT